MEKLLLLFLLATIEPFEIDKEIVKTPELLERIRRLEENPININIATKEELMLIPYIDNILAEKIINYRKEKLFTSKSELLLIDRVNPFLLDRISPYVTVKLKIPKIVTLKGLEILSRYERKISDKENKIYNRIIIPYENIFMSGLFEKDYEDEDYFDYYSISIYEPGKFVVGDFDLDIGMGLIFGKPDFFYAGSGIIPGERGFSPHLSTYEENYLRGAAGGWKNLMLFGSYLQTNNDKEKLVGASYKFNPFRITAAYNSYNSENKNSLLSIYMDKELAGNLLRFEIASGGSKIPEIKENLAYSLGIDNGRGLKAIYANVPAQIPSSRISPFSKNEELIYFHYEKKIIPSLGGIMYTELSRRNTHLTDFERLFGIQLRWNPLRGISVYGRLKLDEDKDGIRLDLIYGKGYINIRNRFEAVNTKNGSGYLAYTGFRYSSKYIFEARFILYETDNWDSRIYEYENDLPGTFTIKQLNGSGRRIYIFLAEKILPFKLYFKWGIDFKDNIEHKVGLAVLYEIL
jgi:hypothetical protein